MGLLYHGVEKKIPFVNPFLLVFGALGRIPLIDKEDAMKRRINYKKFASGAFDL